MSFLGLARTRCFVDRCPRARDSCERNGSRPFEAIDAPTASMSTISGGHAATQGPDAAPCSYQGLRESPRRCSCRPRDVAIGRTVTKNSGIGDPTQRGFDHGDWAMQNGLRLPIDLWTRFVPERTRNLRNADPATLGVSTVVQPSVKCPTDGSLVNSGALMGALSFVSLITCTNVASVPHR
jgi:hypothetical protein